MCPVPIPIETANHFQESIREFRCDLCCRDHCSSLVPRNVEVKLEIVVRWHLLNTIWRRVAEQLLVDAVFKPTPIHSSKIENHGRCGTDSSPRCTAPAATRKQCYLPVPLSPRLYLLICQTGAIPIRRWLRTRTTSVHNWPFSVVIATQHQRFASQNAKKLIALLCEWGLKKNVLCAPGP